MLASEELWDLWGSSHEWSSAITGASAEILTIPGYRVPDDPNAFTAARALLEALQRSPRSRKALWHGRPLERIPKPGEHVSLPLTATTPEKSEALRLSAQGDTQALFTFPAGTRALRYSDIERIVAGRFIVRKVRRETDPYWGTLIVVVQLEEDATVYRQPKEPEPRALEETADQPNPWYHLTDRARFRLDPRFAPEDNAIAIVDRSGRPGIYLGQDVERWVNGYNYWRPFVVEFDVDPSVVEDPGVHGRYGGEMFVPATSFDKLTILRVIPLDAHAREVFGEAGWIEGELGIEFDTGDPIRPGHRSYRGYRYSGPDVRDMPPSQVNHLKRQLRQVKRQ